jgi:uroporphyrinogen-III synthase
MENKRILSTKVLNKDELNQLYLDGHEVEQWNFIRVEEKKFSINLTEETLIFSSQNAVNSFFGQNQNLKNRDCICVGEKTKELLKKKKQNVINFFVSSKDMVKFLERNLLGKKFIFLTGNQRMNNIENFFDNQNDNFRVVEVYKSYCNSKYFIDFDIALFFSPSGVRCFAELNSFENIDCFAIGESTANELKNYTKKIHIAKKPTIGNLIERVNLLH